MTAIASGKTSPISVSPDLRCQNRSPISKSPKRTPVPDPCRYRDPNAVLGATYSRSRTRTPALKCPAALPIDQFTKMAGCCPACFDVYRGMARRASYRLVRECPSLQESASPGAGRANHTGARGDNHLVCGSDPNGHFTGGFIAPPALCVRSLLRLPLPGELQCRDQMFEVSAPRDNVVNPTVDCPTPEIFIDYSGRQNNAWVSGN